MTLLRLILLAAGAVAGVLAHPAAGQDAAERRDDRLSYNPGGLMQTAADSPLPYNPGGPMLPVETGPASASTTTSAAAAKPTSPPHRTPLRPGQPASDIRDCTMQLTVSATKPICPADHVDTAYPSTVTVTRQVDCHGCAEVNVRTTPILFCPVDRITASTSVATPTTEFVTVCSPTTAFGQLTTHAARRRGLAPAAACPTTFYVDPAQDTVSVSYQSVVTATSRVSCGGCPLVVATRLGGLGPLVRPKPALTSAVGTTTTYVCG